MSKYNTCGFLFWIGGLILLIFQATSYIIKGNDFWTRITFSALVDPQYLEWVNSIKIFSLNKVLEYVMTIPLITLLFIAGSIMFVINGLKNAR